MQVTSKHRRKVTAIPMQRSYAEDTADTYPPAINYLNLPDQPVNSSVSSSTSNEGFSSISLSIRDFRTQNLQFRQSRNKRMHGPGSVYSLARKLPGNSEISSSADYSSIMSESVEYIVSELDVYDDPLYRSRNFYQETVEENSASESEQSMIYIGPGELAISMKDILELQKQEKEKQELKKRLIKQQLLRSVQTIEEQSDVDTERMPDKCGYLSGETEDGPGSSLYVTHEESSLVRLESSYENICNSSLIKHAVDLCLNSSEARKVFQAIDKRKGSHYVILLDKDEFCGVYWSDDIGNLHKMIGYAGTPALIKASMIYKKYIFAGNKFRTIRMESTQLPDAVSIA